MLNKKNRSTFENQKNSRTKQLFISLIDLKVYRYTKLEWKLLAECKIKRSA